MSQINNAKSNAPSMVRVQSALRQLGIGKTSLYRKVKKGKFSIVKRGNCSYVPQAEIDAYLDPNGK